MAGCPAALPGERTAHFDAGGWLPDLARRLRAPVGRGGATLLGGDQRARRGRAPVSRHLPRASPGQRRLQRRDAWSGSPYWPNLAANLDPSHLFWQQMDPLAVAARLGDRVAHANAKDVVFNPGPLGLNPGLLDHRWSPADPNSPWTFAAAGRGHGEDWWRAFLAAVGRCGVETTRFGARGPAALSRRERLRLRPRRSPPHAGACPAACSPSSAASVLLVVDRDHDLRRQRPAASSPASGSGGSSPRPRPSSSAASPRSPRSRAEAARRLVSVILWLT